MEFFGPGVSNLTVGERAVVANMAPEYGATTGYFPVDGQVLDYLAGTGRSAGHIELVEAYLRRAGLWFDPEAEPAFTRVVEIDLSAIRSYAAGPRRPQDLLPHEQIPAVLAAEPRPPHADRSPLPEFPMALASITSCTNTPDPRLLVPPACWPGGPAAWAWLSPAGSKPPWRRDLPQRPATCGVPAWPGTSPPSVSTSWASAVPPASATLAR